MFPAERRRRLFELLQSEQSLTVARLAEALSVSEATVRRDLQLLEREGRIRRSYGGAYLPSVLGVEPPLAARQVERQREKRAIARAAAAMLREHQVVALDVGTTTFELAKVLRRAQNLTIFTNSIPAAEVLSGTSHQVYVLGGLLRHQEFSLVGSLTREMVTRFHFDVFFLGVAGFDPKTGFSDYSVEDVEVKRAFIAAAHTTVALVDSSKWRRVALAHVAPLSAVSAIVTDQGVGEHGIREIEKAGVRCIVADIDEEWKEEFIS